MAFLTWKNSMNKARMDAILYPVMLLILASCSGNQSERYRMDLAGEWNFRIDSLDQGIEQEWFSGELPEVVRLPGSMLTNDKGDVEKYLSLDLASGRYNIKFFVKDPANYWRVVLYNDFFIFTVK